MRCIHNDPIRNYLVDFNQPYHATLYHRINITCGTASSRSLCSHVDRIRTMYRYHLGRSIPMMLGFFQIVLIILLAICVMFSIAGENKEQAERGLIFTVVLACTLLVTFFGNFY